MKIKPTITLWWKQLTRPNVSNQQLVVFTRQLATLIEAGIPINRALKTLGRQSNKQFTKAIKDVAAKINQGKDLSEALNTHPQIWDELYVNLVKAGEKSGGLTQVLLRLCSYLEKAQKLRRQVVSAMIYPTVLMVVACLVTVVMLWKVIPVFQNMMKDMGGGSLPAPTLVVIGLSEFVRNNIILIFFSVFGLISSFSFIKRTKWGRAAFDKIILKIPLVGTVIRKAAVARFGRTIGTLLSSGIMITDALETAASTSGNTVIAKAINFARVKITEGKTLAEPLEKTNVFEPMVIDMVQVGEETGQLDAMLSKVADFYEDEVDVAVANLTKLMEPFLMVFIAVVIGGLLISMYLPIFEMAGNIKVM